MAARSKKAKARKERKYSNAKEIAQKALTFEPSAISLPDGTSLWRPKKEGVYRMEILPYEVGKGNPNADEGMVHWERTFYVHSRIGPNQQWFLCPAQTLGKKCPICEFRAKLMKDVDSDEEMIAALAPKKRQLFNILVHGEEDKGIQLFEYSFHQFGKLLFTYLKNDDEDEYQNFSHLDDGQTLKVSFDDKGAYGKEASVIEFKPRKTELDEDLLDQTHCLDDLMKETPFKEMKNALLQTTSEDDDDDDDDDDEDEKPKSKSKAKSKPAAKSKSKKKVEEDGDDEDEDGEDWEDDEEDDEEEDEDDVDEEDEDEDEKPKKSKSKSKPKAKAKSKPKAKAKKSSSSSKKKVVEDDDDDDDDEDDEEEEDDDDDDWS